MCFAGKYITLGTSMQIMVLKVLLKYSATLADQGTGTCSLHYERSLSFEGFGGGMLLHRLDHEGICVSTGSACNSKDTQILSNTN